MPEDVETIYERIDYYYNENPKYLSGKEKFRVYLPMIDLEKIIDSIIPSILCIYIYTDEASYEFEFNSMELGHDLLLATVCSINQDGKLLVIDNRG